MSFAPEGYPIMAVSGVSAVTIIAASVWRRSWSLWLFGVLMLLVAAWVAWMFRSPPCAPSARVGTAATAGAQVPCIGDIRAATPMSKAWPATARSA